MQLSPFAYKDYKSFLRAAVENGQPVWGLISRLAEAAQCQRSYLSRVLNSEVHLTIDHACGIAEALKLAEMETEFFLTLVELERASSLLYRKRVNEKLKRLRSEHEDLNAKVKRPKASMSSRETVYYSSWVFSALHILVSIPQYRTTKAIANRLQLPEEIVNNALSQLNEWGFVRREEGKWNFAASEIHVSKDSPLSVFHHGNWRQRATLDAQLQPSDSVHFTVVQSLDQSAWERIKQRLLKFIDETQQIAGPAKEEKLICLAIDFFEV